MTAGIRTLWAPDWGLHVFQYRAQRLHARGSALSKPLLPRLEVRSPLLSTKIS